MTGKMNPVGYRVEASYNSQGQVLRLEDAEGALLTNRYDDKGNLTEIKEATGATSTFGYNEAGQPTGYTDQQLQKQMGFTYDDSGNVASMTDPANTVISFA